MNPRVRFRKLKASLAISVYMSPPFSPTLINNGMQFRVSRREQWLHKKNNAALLKFTQGHVDKPEEWSVGRGDQSRTFGLEWEELCLATVLYHQTYHRKGSTESHKETFCTPPVVDHWCRPSTLIKGYWSRILDEPCGSYNHFYSFTPFF